MSKKMNPEIKKRWVEALRSGKYKQGRDMLCDDQGNYCCLGVLVDILTPDPTSIKWDDIQLPYDIARQAHVQVAGLLPDNRYLTNLNDNGTPFTEIADIIEEQL